MGWLRRVLTDTEDDGRFRSSLGVIAGACLAIMPLLFGQLDVAPSLSAALIGAAVAPFWRYAGESVGSRLTIIASVLFLIASVIVLRQLPSRAFFVFLGGFTLTLSLLRLVTGWWNPVRFTPEQDLEPGPTRPVLVLAVVVPLLALVALVVIVIAAGGETIR
jgi:hypothetical protein